MFGLPSPSLERRCQLTARFLMDGQLIVVQCLGERQHVADCTMLEPTNFLPVQVPRSATKW
jgi:hypothetical protein